MSKIGNIINWCLEAAVPLVFFIMTIVQIITNDDKVIILKNAELLFAIDTLLFGFVIDFGTKTRDLKGDFHMLLESWFASEKVSYSNHDFKERELIKWTISFVICLIYLILAIIGFFIGNENFTLYMLHFLLYIVLYFALRYAVLHVRVQFANNKFENNEN